MRVRTARVTRFVARTTAIAFRRRGFATEIPIAKAEQTRKYVKLAALYFKVTLDET